MNSSNIRKTFIDFFQSKTHQIVSSAPMVVKNDPTLMFTNAGMNQFKDIFLGNSPIKNSRIANSQKCLRVSGKHNDLEEVGHDTYHHTMFEMLGNWSFADYFKKDAITWAWELLTKVYKIDERCLYVTIFEGDKNDGTEEDTEAYNFWKEHISEDRILKGSKKDNFWEMGDAGPCGPCSEVHVDIRSEEDKKLISGKELVNEGHPLVIEIWNLVFIQYNRKANGVLEKLSSKHIDTGMGFERLCMVIQNKKSNYDTDVFQPIIQKIAQISDKKYGQAEKQDIAMRVIADHVRAIAFSIADGQLPSNNGAGYVIRRILRRAVRYGYTFLDLSEPFINKLIPTLIQVMGEAFNELVKQKDIIEKVIFEEEQSFLKTLETGIKRFDSYVATLGGKTIIDGKFAFELYDTYGFPIDLTQLMASEKSLSIDMDGFTSALEDQKNRSRQAAVVETGDWTTILSNCNESFIGYDTMQSQVNISRYRKVTAKGKEFYHLVFDKTPFYAESGGQVGDSGYIEYEGNKTPIIDTQKENNLIVHITEQLPEHSNKTFNAVVEESKRNCVMNNHTATHLLNEALRQVLGTHVEQRGSLVNSEYLRFDFSHFQKLTDEEIKTVESVVNESIRKNIPLDEKRAMPIDEAKKLGAVATFGEKYGDFVRVIKFGNSMELCGGTHVASTGQIGYFKIISESAIAAGIRRIEAITSIAAEKYITSQLNIVSELKQLLKSNDLLKSVHQLIEDNSALNKKIEALSKEKAKGIKQELLNTIEQINGVNVIAQIIQADSAQSIKDIAFQIKPQIENLFFVVGAEINGKATLTIMISENLVEEKKLHAGNIIKEISKEIEGGGGGQAHFATAGGNNPKNMDIAIAKAKGMIS